MNSQEDWKHLADELADLGALMADRQQLALTQSDLVFRAANELRAMLSSSPKGMEPVGWRETAEALRREAVLLLSNAEAQFTGLHGQENPPGWLADCRRNIEALSQPLYVSPVEGRASRDHDQSTTDGQGNPTLAASGLVPFDKDVLFWAFRYALGRMTYAVADVTLALHAHKHRLPSRMRENICREISECSARGGLGQPCDERAWIAVRDALEALEDGDGAGHGTASTSDQGCSSRDAIPLPTKKEGQ